MKKIFTPSVFLFLIASVYCSAQPPAWLWAKGAGGTANERAIASVADPLGTGAVYVTGNFAGPSITFGTTTLNGANDVFIVKYSSSGSVVWAINLNKGSSITVSGITADAAGDIYVSWGSSMNLDKFNSSGTFVWSKTFTYFGGINAVSTTTSNDLYITGVFTDSLIFGPDTLVNTGITFGDIFVARITKDGNGVWGRSIRSNYANVPRQVCSDASGNCFITGEYYGDTLYVGTDMLLNTGGYDFFVAKYSAQGAAQWVKGGTGKGFSAEQAFAVVADPLGSGAVYVAGSFTGDSLKIGSTTLQNANLGQGYSDIFIVKYSSSGSESWVKGYGGGFYDAITGLTTDVAGNVYACGYLSYPGVTFGTTTLANTTYYADPFVVKFSSGGNPTWAISGSGAEDDQAFTIAPNIAVANEVYVAGNFTSLTATFGSNSLTHAGTTNFTDMFVAKVGSGVGIEEMTGENKLRVYPNPSTGSFTVYGGEFMAESMLDIYNLVGEKVHSQIVSSKEEKVNCKLSPGMYFIKISDGEKVHSGKVLVENISE